MCRYAYKTYKSHYACFSCRKAFKHPPIVDYFDSRGLAYAYRRFRMSFPENRLGHRLEQVLGEYQSVARKCPECSDAMVDMGLDFKPPKQSDAKARKTLQGMYRAGHAFHTCGCNGPGWIPKSTNDYRNYLATMKDHYQEQLKRVRNASGISVGGKLRAIRHWKERIEAVEREEHKRKREPGK